MKVIDFLENITRLDLVRTLSFGDTVSFLVSLVSLVIASLALKRQFYAPAKLDIYQLTTETLGGSASGG
ncbi:MAG TPA: hypothetical protein VLA04_03395, partial [Verrucomicrobiae bacterium]|nr:hypothetical protein [Verrucomicrobiae bacterium]